MPERSRIYVDEEAEAILAAFSFSRGREGSLAGLSSLRKIVKYDAGDEKTMLQFNRGMKRKMEDDG